jgi:chemosensory pili system protein ChpA (sensor histidine kinase/response regulator)
MSALREAMSHAVLGWVKPELDQTLRLVRGEIESFAENPADTSRMHVCVGYLHQVQGTLHMVELYAPAMVAEELEKLAQALQDGQVADANEACATLMRGTVLLPDYLERLQSGHRDIPIVLLPLLNDIRAARGEPGLSESVLFAPDLERPLPQDVPATEPMPGGARDSRVAHAQEHLERVLAGWPEHGAPADPAALVSALAPLQRLAEPTAAKRMLWVATNVAEALRDGALQASPALHQGFSGVLRAVRQGRQGLVPGTTPGQEPTRQLLYQVAHSSASHPALDDLRKAFDLQAASPSEAEIEHARSSLSGRNRALLDTVGGAVKEELMRVKDALDLQLRTHADIAGLAPQVAQLGSVADTLGMMGLGLARNVVLQQRESLAELIDGRRSTDESALMDIAGALLYVDASLDDQVAHLGDGSGAPDTQAVEAQRTVEALAGEAIRNFAEARQQFVGFIETGWEHAQLDATPRLLGEVAGALRMLELSEPADYVEGVRQYIGTELIERRRVPSGAQLDTVADAMASLEYYLEALREHRPNRDEILRITRSSLESLRYWPLPAQAPAAPVVDAAPAAEAATFGFEPESAPHAVDTGRGEHLGIERGPELPAFVPAEATAAAFDPVASEFDQPAGEDAARVDAAFAAPAVDGTEAEAAPDSAFDAPAPESAKPAGSAESFASIEHAEPPGQAAPVALSASEPGFAEAAPAVETAAPAVENGQWLQPGFDLSGSNDIDDEIRDVFLEEFDEEIVNLGQMLPAWTADVENLERLRPIRRVFHTLKGSGRLVGANLLGEFSWKVENMLNRVLDGSRPATPAVVALLERATDTLPQLNAALRGEQGARADLAGIEAVADRLAAGEEALYRAPDAAAAPAPVAETPVVADFVPDLDGTPASVDSVLREILETEVGNHLRTVDAWLASAQPAQAGAATDPLLRAFHTMNGAFAMADVPEITEITGRAEQYVKGLLANGVAADAAGVAGLAAAAQAIGATIAALQSPQPRIPLFADLRAQLSALRDALPQATRAVSTVVDDRGQHTYAAQGAQDMFAPDVSSPVELTSAMDLSAFIGSPADLVPSPLAESFEASESAGTADTDEAFQAAEASPGDAAPPPALLSEDGQAAWYDLRFQYHAEPKWTDAPAPTSADAQVTVGDPASLDPLAAEFAEADVGADVAPAADTLEAHAERDPGVDVEALSNEDLLPTAGDDADVAEQAISDSRGGDLAAAAGSWPEPSDAPEPDDAAALEPEASDVELTQTEAAAEAMGLAEPVDTATDAPGAVDEAAEVSALERTAAAEEAGFTSEDAVQDSADDWQAQLEAPATAEDAQAEAGLPSGHDEASDPEASVEPGAADGVVSPLQPAAAEIEDASAQHPASDPAAAVDVDAEVQPEPALQAELAAPLVDLPETAAPDVAPVEEEAASSPVDEAAAAVEEAAAGFDHAAAADAVFEPESAFAPAPAPAPAPVAPEAEPVLPSAHDAQDLPPTPQTTEAPAMAEQMLDFTVLDRDLVDIFVEEGNDLLDHSDGLLAHLRGAPDDRGLVIGLQRDLHTIKGGARMAGIEPIGDLGHAIESLLEQVAEQRAEVDRGVIGLLERGFDVLHGMLARTAAYYVVTPRPELVAEFDARARGELTGAGGTDTVLRGTALDLVEPQDIAISHEFATPDQDQGVSAEADEAAEAGEVAEQAAASGSDHASEAEAASEVEAEAEAETGVFEAQPPLDADAAEDVPSGADATTGPFADFDPAQDRPSHDLDLVEESDAGAPAFAAESTPEADSAQSDAAAEPADEAFLDADLLAALDAALGTSYGAATQVPENPAPIAAPTADETAADLSPSPTDRDPETTAEAVPESAPTPDSEPAAPQPAFAIPAAAPPLRPQPIPELPPLSAPIELQASGEDEHHPLSSGQEQVRVRADLLDQLVNHAGEVAIYRARLEQQMGAFRAAMAELDRTNTRLHDQLRRLDLETEAQIVARYQREQDTRDAAFDPLELDRFSTLQQLSRALGESAADISGLQGVLDDLARQNDSLLGQQSRVSSELQDGLMRARMVPFEGSVPRLRRVLRQAAADTGKQAQLQLEGAHGELDRNVLERMTAPLEHLLRNAVAHGLESPQARRDAGKPEEGVVRVVLRREGSEMVLQVADDGAGIDHAAIRRRAEQRGMLQPGAELAEIDLERLILEPGFSTYEEVSQLAGRGVGMDVVHNEVRQLGGSLEISSTRGQGTTFTLRLPQTLAVTQAVFVQIGDTQFAVPVAAVGGVGRISRQRFEAADASYVYGGEEYALHDLGTLVGQGPTKAEGQPQVPLLLVRAGELRAAVAVDQVLGNREIVVKPVGPQIGSIPGIYGATITGDGSVVVILDAAPLVRRYIAQPALAAAAAAPVEQRHVPLVMVVDDSLTMRKVTSRVLERHNFEVSTARDGLEALERLEERVPDLMLLDIEMPRMDGYELATAMKADPRFAEVPIVMITSRTGEKHRQRALEIGVQRYMGKPYQELDLLRNVYDLLGIARARE